MIQLSQSYTLFTNVEILKKKWISRKIWDVEIFFYKFHDLLDSCTPARKEPSILKYWDYRVDQKVESY